MSASCLPHRKKLTPLSPAVRFLHHKTQMYSSFTPRCPRMRRWHQLCIRQRLWCLIRQPRKDSQDAITEILVRPVRPARRNPPATGATRMPAEHSCAGNRVQGGSTHTTIGSCQKSTHDIQQTLAASRRHPATRRWPRNHNTARQMNCTPCTPSGAPQGNASDSGLCNNTGSYCNHLAEAWIDWSAGRLRRSTPP